MSIAGASDSLVQLLRLRLTETGGLNGFTVTAMASRDVRPNLQNRVGILLYRVGLDRTRRHIDLPRLAPAAPARTSLGVELHYMLVVWSLNSAEGEQVMLGRCTQILILSAKSERRWCDRWYVRRRRVACRRHAGFNRTA